MTSTVPLEPLVVVPDVAIEIPMITIVTFQLPLRGDLSFDDRLAQARLNRVDPEINSANLPITDTQTCFALFVLVSFGKRGTAKDVLRWLKHHQIIPARHEHGFDFLDEFSEELGKGDNIAFLGSTGKGSQGEDANLCVYEFNGARAGTLEETDITFSETARFGGFRINK